MYVRITDETAARWIWSWEREQTILLLLGRCRRVCILLDHIGYWLLLNLRTKHHNEPPNSPQGEAVCIPAASQTLPALPRQTRPPRVSGISPCQAVAARAEARSVYRAYIRHRSRPRDHIYVCVQCQAEFVLYPHGLTRGSWPVARPTGLSWGSGCPCMRWRSPDYSEGYEGRFWNRPAPSVVSVVTSTTTLERM